MAAAALASAAEMKARHHPLGTPRGGERAARCVWREVSAGGQSEATRACARAEGPAGRVRGERAEARSRVYMAARGEPGECGGGAAESKRTIPLCVHVLLSAWCGHPLAQPTQRLDDSAARRGARALDERSVAGVAAAVRPAGDGGSGGRAPRAVGGVGGGGRHPWRGRLPTETGGGTAALALAETSAAAPPHGARRNFDAGKGVGRPCARGGGGRGAVCFPSPAPVVCAPKDQVAAGTLRGNCWPEKLSSVVAAAIRCRERGRLWIFHVEKYGDLRLQDAEKGEAG